MIAVMPLRRLRLFVLAISSILGAVTACTPVPEGYEFWKQVNREYESQDYINTLNYLNDILRTENDYTARAAALKVVILGGTTRAALEIEDACVAGISRVPAWDSGPYKNCIEAYRWQARTSTLALIDALPELEKSAAASGAVPLDFPLPETSSDASPMIGRTRAGAMPVEQIFEPSVVRLVDHHIFLQVGDMVATDDAAAVKKMFESRPVTVPKEAFLVGVAKTLLLGARVFGADQLDDSTKKSATLERARECLQPALKGSDAKLKSEAEALTRKISSESSR
jgi:hypothetical protein